LNTAILSLEVQQFINAHLNKDLQQLILKGSPFDKVTIQELANQIQAKQKAKTKLPICFNTPGIYFPAKISIEQTSSKITAQYKASLFSGVNFIDLTAGFGVDTYYFSKAFKSGIHCEINKELSEIVMYNYEVLGVNNVAVLAVNGLDYLKQSDKNFDLIYIDPSRRNKTKGKVFLLEDYEPNIVKNINLLVEKSNAILIKVSPLLDLTNLINSLQFVAEIHCVAVQNEMKELLIVIRKNHNQKIQIKTINFLKNSTQNFNFEWQKHYDFEYSLPKKYLYEPNSAIMKSGAFETVANKYNLGKLHKHTHLYTNDSLIAFAGRFFEIKAILSPNKKEIKKHLATIKANITTRNYPDTVAEIRKKFQLKDGGDDYLFFCTNLNDKKIVLHCKKVN
jgi:16S rRNA G966 N2-methylase RsmD